MDRISELPDSVLHDILCHLPQKQAIQTSVLSKSWRHLGPTRPKLEFREPDSQFATTGEFLENLDNILRRYDRQNLPLQEFVLEMSKPLNNSISISLLGKLIPMVLTSNILQNFNLTIPMYVISPRLLFQPESLTDLHLNGIQITTDSGELFPIKNLKTLSLDQVRIHKPSLENLIRSCPLIEHLLLSGFVGSSNITFVLPTLIFQAEFLSELRLSWCKLNFKNDTLFLIKCLKILSLESVDITDKTLEKIILGSSRSIEYIHVSDRRDTLMRTIKIYNCLNLKSLHLHRVNIPQESFNTFSVFPALQDLELKSCIVFQDIQLTLRSVKRLVIIIHSNHMIDKATIYAPKVRYFELSVHTPPRLTFYKEDACREWKSHVVVVPSHVISDDNVLPWLLQLCRLLNALRESQISLKVSVLPLMNLTVEGSNDVGFCKPVAVEHLNLTGVEHFQMPTSSHAFLNCLFLLCRPRCITISRHAWIQHTENKLAEYIIHNLIRKQGEMSSRYFWEQYLEEASMEVWDNDFKEWLEPVEGTSFFESSTPKLQIRFQLKWKD